MNSLLSTPRLALFLWLMTLFFAITAWGAAPANDNFAKARLLNGPQGHLRGTSNIGATLEAGEPRHNPTPGGHSVWYRWTAPRNGRVTFNTGAFDDEDVSEFDTLLAAYSGDQLSQLKRLATNEYEDSGDYLSLISFPVKKGTTYNIVVDGAEGDQGTIVLNWMMGPQNDNFADASPLTGTQGRLSGTSNVNATLEVGEPRHNPAFGGHSVWYRWTAPRNGRVTFNTGSFDDSATSEFDTLLAAYSGAQLNQLKRLATNNDDEVGPYLSVISFPVSAGTTYHIVVDGAEDEQGTIILNWVMGPQNDNFADAAVLSGNSGMVSGTTINATTESGEPPRNDDLEQLSVWYRWRAPSTGHWQFELEDSTEIKEMRLSVYTGTKVSALKTVVPAVYNDEDVAQLRFPVKAGTDYYFSVAGSSDSNGAFRLKWSRIGNEVPNDDFIHAQNIGGNSGAVTGDVENATREPGEPLHNGMVGGHSIWYRWTAPQSGQWNFSRSSGTLAIYTGTNLSHLQAVPTSTPLQAQSGHAYFCALDLEDSSDPAFADYRPVLSWARVQSSQNSNDDWENARVIVGPRGSVAGTVAGATLQSLEPHDSQVLSSVWYKWTAPSTGFFSFDIRTNSFGKSTTVYTGDSLATLQVVAKNDDTGNVFYNVLPTSSFSFAAIAGKVYWIAVGKQGYSLFDPFLLQWQPGTAGPENDNFAAARSIEGPSGSVTGTNSAATLENGEKKIAPDAAGRTVWYRWTAPATARTTFDVSGSNAVAIVAVWKGGTLATLQRQGTSAPNQKASRATFDAVAGTTYSISLDGVATLGTGMLVLNWQRVDNSPANDDFANSTTLTGLVGKTSGSTVGASQQASEPSHAGNPGGASIWFSWTAPRTQRLTFSTTGSDFDTLLAIYTGNNLNALTLADKGVDIDYSGPARSYDDDAGPGATSAATFNVRAGVTYRIAVDGSAGRTGNYVLQWGPPPANDFFSDAQILHGSTGSVACSNIGATRNIEATDATERLHGVIGGSSVWFQWTAPTTGIWSFDTLDSDFDTGLAVYGGANPFANSDSEAQPLGSNDNANGSSAPELGSRVTFRAVAGHKYFIALDGNALNFNTFSLNSFDVSSGDSGNAVLAWAPLHNTVPNDFASDAQRLSGNSGRVTGSTRDATYEFGEKIEGEFSLANGHSVWYRWRAPATGIFTFDTQGSQFDTAMAVYVRQKGTAEPVTLADLRVQDRNDNADPQNTSSLTFSAQKGQEFWIAIDGSLGESGDFVLNWGPPPTNDSFQDATALNGERGTQAGTNRRASVQVLEGEAGYEATGGAGKSVWYRWRAPKTGRWSFDLQNSDFDTVLTVWRGASIATLSLVVANDNGSSRLSSRLAFEAHAGDTFWIAVDGYRGDSGQFVLAWNPASAAPPNDLRASAQLLAGPSGRVTGTNIGATREAGEDNHNGQSGGVSVWYRWTAPSTGTWVFDTGGSNFSTVLALYDPVNASRRGVRTAGAPRPQPFKTPATDKDTRPAPGSNVDLTLRTSAVAFQVSVGTTYDIVVDGLRGAQGNVVLAWRPGVPNDNFLQSQRITGPAGSIAAQNTGATREDYEPNHAGVPGGASVWYVWRAPASGTWNFDTIGSGFNTLLAVYTALPDQGLTLVASNDDRGGPAQQGSAARVSQVSLTVREGADYYIAIDGANGETGAFKLNWSALASRPANDDFAAAQTLSGPSGQVAGTVTGATSQEKEPDHGVNTGSNSIWYRWVAPTDGQFTFDLAGSQAPALLAFYTGQTLDELTAVGTAIPAARRTLTFQAGQTYFIAVTGAQGAQGAITLSWQDATSAVDGDAFETPIALTGNAGQMTGSTVGATRQSGEPLHANRTGGASLWFSWKAPKSGRVTFSTGGSKFDTLLAAYTGVSLPSLIEVASNDDQPPLSLSQISFDAVQGTTYWIAVDGYNGAAGSYALNWNLPTSSASSKAESSIKGS